LKTVSKKSLQAGIHSGVSPAQEGVAETNGCSDFEIRFDIDLDSIDAFGLYDYEVPVQFAAHGILRSGRFARELSDEVGNTPEQVLFIPRARLVGFGLNRDQFSSRVDTIPFKPPDLLRESPEQSSTDEDAQNENE